MDSLSAEKAAALPGGAYKVTVLKCADSTNTLLLKAAENGAPAGTVLIARSQSAGRGRLGRAFRSKSGGLYMSLLLRPDGNAEKARLFTPLAALAAAEAVEELTGKHLLIKWVNDLFSDGKKVGGILCETPPCKGGAPPNCVVIGIGLNVFEPEGGFGAELEGKAAALFPRSSYNEGLLDRLAAETALRIFSYAGSPEDESLRSAYERRLFVAGETLFIRRGEARLRLKVLGLNLDYSLEVETEDGERLTLRSVWGLE